MLFTIKFKNEILRLHCRIKMSEHKEVICIYCNKYFKPRGLKFHQKLCSQNNQLTCKFCLTQFENNRNLLRHIKNCDKISDWYEHEIVKLKKDLDNALNCSEKQKQENIKLKESFTSEKQRLINNFNEEKMSMLKDTIQAQKTKNLTVINNNSTTTNNNNLGPNINQIILKLDTVKKNEIAELVQDILYRENLPDSEQHLATEMYQRYFESRLIKTDHSRQVVGWKDEDEKQIKDPKGLVLSRKIYEASSKLFQEKVDELHSDLLSPTLSEAACKKVVDWIDLFNRISVCDSKSMKEFGKQLAALSKEKSAFRLEKKSDPLSPIVDQFEEFFYQKYSFKAFCTSINELASYIREHFSKSIVLPNYGEPEILRWIVECDDEEDTEKTMQLTKDDLSIVISSVLSIDMLVHLLICKSSNSENIYGVVNNQSVVLTNSESTDNLIKNFYSLQDKDSPDYDEIYENLFY